MKSVIFFLLLFLSTISFSKDPVSSLIRKIETSNNLNELLNLKTELQKSLNKSSVHYHYYSGYVLMRASNYLKDDDEKDKQLDQALEYALRADSISPDNSEVKVLLAAVYLFKLVISPTMRYFKYGSLIDDNLALAKKLNPENPRAYYISGQWISGKPSFVGGSKEEGCKQFALANEKYNKIKLSELDPSWGKLVTSDKVRQCN